MKSEYQMNPTESSERVWTFRDAGQLPLALRAVNTLGRLKKSWSQLDADAIAEAAIKAAGLSDFGGSEWREGLEQLCTSANQQSNLKPFSAIAQKQLYTQLLAQRLMLIEYTKQNPTVLNEQVDAPFIVLGMPRTGTTLLSYLLDLDPRSRSLLSWESTQPIPPPTMAGHAVDPRIAQAEAQEQQMAKLIPPAPAMHPLGAAQPTECIPLLMMDFRSLGFETQFMAPNYGQWLENCDMSSAYRIHKQVLQTLQSTIPTARWALKTPQHLWSLPALLACYPKARLIWTHRDPASVVASTASLNHSFYRTWMNDPNPAKTGPYWAAKLEHAVTAGMRYADAADVNWCCDVHYQDLMADPVETVRRIYAHYGESLDELHVHRMQVWMATRPQNTFGRHGYDISDFGLSKASVRAQFGEYMQRFGIVNDR